MLCTYVALKLKTYGRGQLRTLTSLSSQLGFLELVIPFLYFYCKQAQDALVTSSSCLGKLEFHMSHAQIVQP